MGSEMCIRDRNDLGQYVGIGDLSDVKMLFVLATVAFPFPCYRRETVGVRWLVCNSVDVRTCVCAYGGRK